jgi:hypothetical protein
MNVFVPYTPYGNEDIEAYLRRFTSFLSTKGVIQPAPLAAGASAQEKAAHAVLVAAYDNRKSWFLASTGPDSCAILDNLCGAQTPENRTVLDLENMLKTHFRPARNKRTKRDKFNSRRQLPQSRGQS